MVSFERQHHRRTSEFRLTKIPTAQRAGENDRCGMSWSVSALSFLGIVVGPRNPKTKSVEPRILDLRDLGLESWDQERRATGDRRHAGHLGKVFRTVDI